ncbi:MAG TPA: hypothetical protein VK903_14675 [Propionicimonas sp.]|nr:hypothetical protein [Propionicimonas sp.]
MAAQSAVRRSWLSLLGLPVAMLGTVVVGTWAGSLAGVGHDARAPAWLAVGLVAMMAALFGVAAALTYRFCREAAAAGAPRAMTPVWIVIAVGVLVILQNLVAYLFTWPTGFAA